MKIKVAIAQFSMPDNYEKCIEKADEYIKTASKNGVDLLLLPELFEGLYFCQIENYDFFSKAEEVKDSKTLKHFQEMAKEYKIVLPISFFEKSGNCYFNSLVMIDKDGTIVGRQPGLRGWIGFYTPALLPHYKTLMAYKALAEHLGVFYADAKSWNLPPAYDGIHLSEDGNRLFADRMEETLNNIALRLSVDTESLG